MAEGEHRCFRHITRERLLQEMLRSAKSARGGSGWKVLIMDELTVKVMSSSCKMADITDEGVSLVEDLNKRRQPLPALEAVYFIQPLRESVKKFVSDMSGKSPLYKKAYVYFSSTLPRELLKAIKDDKSLMSRLSILREVNLEYLTIDMQGFVTDNDRALQKLFCDEKDYDNTLDTIASRLGTVFASFKEFPSIRYRAARSAAANSTATTTACDLLPTKLAACLWDRLMKYKASLAEFPQNETCELLILDRTVDPIAPVIHEWTYEAMCHDLLNLEGNKYSYEITTSSGKREQKDVLLDEHDPIWVELRHLHIGEVSMKLHERMKQFYNRNKAAAEMKLGGRDGQDLSTRDMQKIVQTLPQFRDQVDKLSLHVDIATVLNERIRTLRLSDVGELEQNMVFGDASSKELITFLSTAENVSADCKLRLLMIYAATHPEKLDDSKRAQWLKLARLGEADMAAVSNLEYLGISVTKKQQSGGFSLKFSKNKHLYRKERNHDEEQQWTHSRFTPLLQELVEELDKGSLSKEDYPYVREPIGEVSSARNSSRLPTAPTSSKPAQSMRTSKPGSTWASRPRASDDGYSSDSVLKNAVSDPKINGKRVFVFVVGGITHSELRAVHKLSSRLKREVVLGSTCIDDPHQFVAKVKMLNDLEILDF